MLALILIRCAPPCLLSASLCHRNTSSRQAHSPLANTDSDDATLDLALVSLSLSGMDFPADQARLTAAIIEAAASGPHAADIGACYTHISSTFNTVLRLFAPQAIFFFTLLLPSFSSAHVIVQRPTLAAPRSSHHAL
jgi:hypothetical protein